MWESIVQDLKHALRLLARQRVFTAAAVLTLALSTGAAAAIFSVIDSALLRPLPYPQPEQLIDIDVNGIVPGRPPSRWAPSLVDVRAWSTARSPLSAVAIERSVFPDRVFDAGVPEHVKSMRVNEQYFQLFGVSPMLGRNFSAGDTQTGAPATIILSHVFWMSRFGGDRAVINRVIRYDGEAATIIGVLSRGFGESIPVWRALQEPLDRQHHRGSGWTVFGRLREGVTLSGASARLAAMLPLEETPNAASGVNVRSSLAATRAYYRTTVNIIAGVVALVVLIACVNVAGLLLARGETRQAEFAVRLAIGARRSRLVRQLLTESLVLSAFGGLAGLGLAVLTLNTLVANIPIALPGDAPPSLSGVVLALTALTVTVTGLLFGLVPALRASRASSSELMARAGRQHAAGLSPRAGQSLVVVEIALAVVALATGGLMLRSFVRLMEVNIGFDPASYLTMRVEPLDQKPATAALFYPALLEKIRQWPGVAAVGAINTAPLVDGSTMTQSRRPDGPSHGMIQLLTVFPGYFEAIGLPVRLGRVFAAGDATGARRIVISEKTAHLFFPDGLAVGGQLEVDGDWADIVGVVPDTSHWGPRVAALPAIYKAFRPAADVPGAPVRFTVLVRPRTGGGNLEAELRQAAQSIGPPILVDSVRPGTAWLGESVTIPRQRTVLLGLLAGLGMLLAVIGVASTTSYAVGRRTQEIGIRLALGATPRRVVRDVLLASAAPIGIGVVIGIGAALLGTQAISTFLFNTSPKDSATLVVVSIGLFTTGIAAAWIPARLAARVDPVMALRSE